MWVLLASDGMVSMKSTNPRQKILVVGGRQHTFRRVVWQKVTQTRASVTKAYTDGYSCVETFDQIGNHVVFPEGSLDGCTLLPRDP